MDYTGRYKISSVESMEKTENGGILIGNFFSIRYVREQ